MTQTHDFTDDFANWPTPEELAGNNPRCARPPGLRAARGNAAHQGGPSGWRMKMPVKSGTSFKQRDGAEKVDQPKPARQAEESIILKPSGITELFVTFVPVGRLATLADRVVRRRGSTGAPWSALPLRPYPRSTAEYEGPPTDRAGNPG